MRVWRMDGRPGRVWRMDGRPGRADGWAASRGTRGGILRPGRGKEEIGHSMIELKRNVSGSCELESGCIAREPVRQIIKLNLTLNAEACFGKLMIKVPSKHHQELQPFNQGCQKLNSTLRGQL